MEIKKQISIFLENRPGSLAKVSEEFGNNNISIEAIMVSESTDHAVVRLICNDPEKAIHLLGEGGLLVIDTNVAAIKIKNEAGALSKLADLFNKHSINMDYAYGSSSSTEASALIVKVGDLAKLQEVLKNVDFVV